MEAYMISKAEERKEIDYLKSVLYVLEKEIEKSETSKESLEVDIRSQMKYIWEEGSTEADDWLTSEQSVRQLNRGVIAADKNLRAYRRMLGSAYFARVDFEEDGEVTPVYLGIATLKDGNEFPAELHHKMLCFLRNRACCSCGSLRRGYNCLFDARDIVCRGTAGSGCVPFAGRDICVHCSLRILNPTTARMIRKSSSPLSVYRRNSISVPAQVIREWVDSSFLYLVFFSGPPTLERAIY